MINFGLVSRIITRWKNLVFWSCNEAKPLSHVVITPYTQVPGLFPTIVSGHPEGDFMYGERSCFRKHIKVAEVLPSVSLHCLTLPNCWRLQDIRACLVLQSQSK